MILRRDTEVRKVVKRGSVVEVLQTSVADPECAMVEHDGIVFPVHWDELAEEQDWEGDTHETDRESD